MNTCLKSVLTQLSIRRRLMLVTFIFLGGFLCLSLLGHHTLETTKVNGPYYDKIIQGKDLIADVLPPPEYIIEAYLLALQLNETTDPEEQQSLMRTLRRLESEYFQRHAFWVANLPDDELKEVMVVQSFEPAKRFFETARCEFFPLLLSGEVAASNALIKGALRENYQHHRAAIDKVVAMARTRIATDESQTRKIIQGRTVTLAGVGLMLAALVAFSSWTLCRSIVTRLDQTVRVLEAVAAGDLSQHLSVSGQDEIGQLARSLNQAIATSRRNFSAAIASNKLQQQFNLKLEDCVLHRTSALHNSEQRLMQAKDAAESANLAKSDFLTSMSHDLRTPLNGILGMNDLLLCTALTDKQRQFVDASRTSGKLLLGLINDVLDLSKIESGKLELDLQECSIEALVYDVIEALGPGARQKGLTLNVHVDSAVSVTSLCDGNRLRQILVNLIGNAIKFTATGTVTVNATCIHREDRLIRVRLAVTDSGIGIPEDRRDRLFCPFSQVDSSTTRKFGGTGLGLSICKQLVELMSGTIGIESQVGIGSTFWFEVPLAVIGQSAETTGVWHQLANARVLIVEDEQRQRKQMSDCLNAWGCQPTPVSSDEDARQAVIRATTAGTRFNAAIVDLQTSSGNRYQLIDELSRRYGLPVIAIESNADTNDANAQQQRFIWRLLRDPVRPSALCDALISTLAVTSGSRPATASDSPPAEVPSGLTGHVLVAEDNRINQMYITELLKHCGCTCDVAANGDEALEAMQRGCYDLVLMDCQMPEMDGFTAAREIRRRVAAQELPHTIPIIALTANALKGDRERCLDAGMDDYLTKPLQIADLQTMLAKYLETQEPVTEHSVLIG